MNIVLLISCALLIALGDPADSNLGMLLVDWLMKSLSFVTVHFVGSGIIIAGASRFIAQKYLQKDQKTKLHQGSNAH